MKELHPESVAKLEEHGVTYIILTGDEDQPLSSTGRDWKAAYNTGDKKVAEERSIINRKTPKVTLICNIFSETDDV